MMIVRYIVSIILLTIPVLGGTVIQIRDFLCGCEYCETVNTGEPLDIGRHMIMCHSWRKGLEKTMALMRETEKPVEVVPKRNETQAETITDHILSTNKDYNWSETNELGWAYASTNQLKLDIDQWIYTEDCKWVWMMAHEPRFLYSYDYGWLYNRLYQNTRIYYWYDRRGWFLPIDINKYIQ